MFALLLSFALCLPLPVAGIIAPDPTATTIKRIDLRRAPQPTHRANLLARDGYVKNCGFVNGNLGLPLDCLPGYDCTHDGIASVSGCCATAATASKCQLDTTCIDWKSDTTPTTSTPRAYYCDKSQPFCTTAYFVDNYAMFTCGDGQKASIVSAFYHASSGAAVGDSASAKEASGSVVASSGSSGSSGNESHDSSTSIGPIVGGVVGGVAVLVIAPTLVWFALRLKRKDRLKKSGSQPSAGTMEMRKPGTAQSEGSASGLCVGDKTPHMYSELEVHPAELPSSIHQAHELHPNSVAATSHGRTELVGSAPNQPYAELDSKSR